MRATLSLLALVLVGLPLRAGEDASRHAQAVAPYVDDQTFICAHIDVSKVNVDLIAKYLDEDNAQKINAVATLAKATFLRSGGKDIYVLMNWATPIDEILIVAPLAEGAAGPALVTLVGQIPGFQGEVNKNVLVAGNKKALPRLKSFKAQPVPDIAKALAAVGEGSAQIVFLPPFALKRALVESFPVLPKEIGNGNTSQLDFHWAAARVDASEALALKVVMQAPDAKSAIGIAKIAGRVLEFAINAEEMKRAIPDIAKVASLLTPKAQGDQLVLTSDDKVLTTLLLPAIQKQRVAAGRQVSMINLKQMGLAMHSYHDQFKHFPAAATYDAGGKPLLSWRVHILPYIDQQGLYRQFKLNEPWDSENNKKLIAQIPPIYRSPAQVNPAAGKTTYLVPVGPKTIFEGKKGIGMRNITDGLSNTIMIVEADDSRAVYWTQPEDYKVDAKNPMAGLVRPEAPGFHAAFADGSVRVISSSVPMETLRALFTANGGEAVNLP